MSKAGGRAAKELGDRQRLSYVTTRLGELAEEVARLKAERKALREKLSAKRAAKKAGADD
ncbi:MAG: hypothetical protein KDK89_19905 [Alphaproteobacteria bacterium]|nr:hypothetical protein [Alphaproteobacteria bacterium]